MRLRRPTSGDIVALPQFCPWCFWRRFGLWTAGQTRLIPSCSHAFAEQNELNSTAMTSASDATLAAAAKLISNLGRGTPFPAHLGDSGDAFSLPGPPSAAKDTLQAELLALTSRVRYLEQRAEVVSKGLPDTPGEACAPTSPLTKPLDARSNSSSDSNGTRTERIPSVSTGARRIHSLLSAKNAQFTPDGERSVSEEDIAFLREHIDKQAEQIKSQRTLIDDISRGLRKSELQAKEAFMKVEREDVSLLERELRKHQQANEAFQKALREIGEVITRVANGDLSSRVQIQATELDHEIVNFKHTINKMMDQLETFGSEVTRVAREVGTDGVLGGQAQIDGVRGIWKELTENGKCSMFSFVNHV